MAKYISAFAASTALTGVELVELSQPSATVKITGITLSAAAADNSYNDSAAGFIAAGFAIGNRVKVLGFVNGVNNILVGVVTALTAGKMTIGGTDGDVIIDEAAGASVTIAKWTTVRDTTKDIAKLVGTAYDFGFSFESTPSASQVVGRVQIGRNITIAANMAGSSGFNSTHATASFAIDVQDNGVSIGTITIDTAGGFTFVTAGGVAVTVSAGHKITFVAPVTPDATVAKVSVVILAEQVV